MVHGVGQRAPPLTTAWQGSRPPSATAAAYRLASANTANEEVTMADTVKRVEYYYATVPDTPGEGLRILSALRERGVDLLAFLAFPSGEGQSQLDLVPADPAALTEAAAQAGVTLTGSKQAFLIQGEDRVGAAAATVEKLASAGVNVRAAAATGASGTYGMILWVAPSDYESAAAALGA
jgi:hypothetical protein